MMETIIYSHNDNHCKTHCLYKAIHFGVNMVESDIIYSRFKVQCTSAWYPWPLKYIGTLEEVYCKELYNLAVHDKLPTIPFWLYLDVKTFNPLLWKPLYNVLKKYQHPAIRYCISTQDRYFYQKPRKWWLKVFMNRYRDELGLIDKRYEMEQQYNIIRVDMYEEDFWLHLKNKIKEFLKKIFG